MVSSQKVFILGLPRTATTSICIATLELGFKTAHTAYLNRTFAQADVLADTPIFADYQQLDRHFSGAKFIYLTRDQARWLPSIRQLLLRMHGNLVRADGGFNPIIKRCYQQVFGPLTLDNINDDAHLIQCFNKHRAEVLRYFSTRPEDLLVMDVSHPGSYQALCDFLATDQAIRRSGEFQHINVGGKVTAWKQIKHPLKVASTQAGRVDKLSY